MKEINIAGMCIAPGVIETIVSIAMRDVPNITAVGATPVNGLMAVLSGKTLPQGIEVATDEEGKLTVGVHVEVAYGTPLPEIAAAVRSVVYDAVTTQIGVPVGQIDVYVDGIQFKD